VRTYAAFNLSYSLDGKSFLKSKFFNSVLIQNRRQFKYLIRFTVPVYPQPAVDRHVLGLTVVVILRFGFAHPPR